MMNKDLGFISIFIFLIVSSIILWTEIVNLGDKQQQLIIEIQQQTDYTHSLNEKLIQVGEEIVNVNRYTDELNQKIIELKNDIDLLKHRKK